MFTCYMFYIRLNSNHSCGVVIVYNSGVMRWRRRGYNYMKITCHISSFKCEYDPRNPYYRSTYIEHITGTTRLSTGYRTSDFICKLPTFKKLKVCFYIAQYPVRWTAQSALHFTPWQTCSFGVSDYSYHREETKPCRNRTDC